MVETYRSSLLNFIYTTYSQSNCECRLLNGVICHKYLYRWFNNVYRVQFTHQSNICMYIHIYMEGGDPLNFSINIEMSDKGCVPPIG